MILHTIIDPNEIMDTSYMKNFQPADCKTLENCVVYGVKCKEGFQINGIFSTNPADYLNPNYESGKFLK